MTRPYALIVALAAATLAAGCGGSSSSPSITVGAARTYQLAGFTASAAVEPGRRTTVAFTIRQPDGSPLTDDRRGSGPHTGVHLIIVRSDLGSIIHRHPPVGPDGRIAERIVFPTPGRYRVVLDAYPNTNGPQPNFQLFRTITVAGAYKPQPLPPFQARETVDGYRFTLHGRPHLRAIEPSFLTVTVTGPDGNPASFTPWYGALAHAIFLRQGLARLLPHPRLLSRRVRLHQHARRHQDHRPLLDAGQADRRRARARRGHVAALPPVPGRRARDDRPLHSEGGVSAGPSGHDPDTRLARRRRLGRARRANGGLCART